MADETALHTRLRELEAAFARTGGAGAKDMDAAGRLRQRLKQVRAKEPDAEFRAGISDEWAQQLLSTLCSRYGIKVYRYRGQRRTTAMVKAPPSFMAEIFWPLFDALEHELRIHIQAVMARALHALECPAAGSSDHSTASKPAAGARS